MLIISIVEVLPLALNVFVLLTLPIILLLLAFCPFWGPFLLLLKVKLALVEPLLLNFSSFFANPSKW